MSNLMITGPNGDGPEQTGGNQTEENARDAGDWAGRQRCHRESRKPGIPSEEDCLRAIAQAAGLVAIGLLDASDANAIRAAFRDILQYHRSRAKEAEKSISNADVLELLRKDPSLLSLLEPLLTQEQIEMITRSAKNGGQGEA